MTAFKLRTELYFGRGKAGALAGLLARHGFKRCGIVIDGALLSRDTFKGMTEGLQRDLAYCRTLVYDRVGEPTYGYLDTVKGFFKNGEVDCLVGIGGGSVIDVTKGLAALITNPVQRSVELRGFPYLANRPVPVVAVPTIAGTGSEVTYNAVFIDDGERRKLGINTEYNFPVFSVADPELTVSAPLRQSVSSALDCMVHSLESFMSVKATFMTRPLSIDGFYYSFRGLERLLRDTGDIDAREMLMKGSYMAGIALMNSSAGPASAMSYPLGSLFGVPHGLAGGFFIRHILRHNLSEGYEEPYILHDRLYGKDAGGSRKEKAVRITGDIIALIDGSGIPAGLSGFGLEADAAEAFIGQFERYCAGSLALNPVKISQETINGFIMNGLNVTGREDKCRALR